MLSQLRTLSLFVDIAQHHHVATAAERHGLTQGAASQRMHQLEKELGLSLFDRSRRPLELTAAGHVFLDGCRDLLQRAERLQHAVQASVISGELSVASIYSAGIELIESVRTALEQRHPGSTITIRYRNPEEVERLVMSGECAVGIVSYPDRLRRLKCRMLREETLVFVASPDHPLMGMSNPIQVNELEGQPMLSLESTLPLARQIRQYLRQHRINVSTGDTFDNIDTLQHALRASRRCAILPGQTVESAVESGQLQTRPLVPSITRPMGMIYHSDNEISLLAEAFMNEIEERAPKAIAGGLQ